MSLKEFDHSISISKFVGVLWIIVGSMLGIHVLLNLIHYQVHDLPWLARQIFDVDEEDSFPTWYSASALLLTSLILWINARAHRNLGSSLRWHWYGLSIGFLVLSVDEIAGMHETLNSLIDVSWAIPGGVLALFIGGVYLRFLSKIDRKTAIQFVLGGALFIGGAVGVELGTEPYLENDELNTLAYNLWTAVEEGMEMGGGLIFLKALLLSMRRGGSSTVIQIRLTD
jgi:hypothetical protein